MGPVYESDYYRLTRERADAYRLVRTAEPFGPVDTLEAALEPMLARLESERPDALLIDLRLAVGRNDPDFEQAFAPMRARMGRAARRTALLMRTRVGGLQVERLARTDDARLLIFHDAEVAERWLLDDLG